MYLIYLRSRVIHYFIENSPFLKVLGVNLLGKGFLLISQLGVLIFLTHNFSADFVGSWSLLQSLVTLLATALTFSASSLIVGEYLERPPLLYLSTAFWGCTAALLVSSLFVFLFFYYTWDTFALAWGISLGILGIKCLEIYSELIYVYYRSQQLDIRAFLSQTGRALITLTTLVIIGYLGADQKLFIQGTLLALVVSLALCDFNVIKSITRRIYATSANYFHLLLQTRGITSGLLLASLSTVLPRYLLLFWTNIEVVGIYHAISYLYIVLTIFGGLTNQIVISRLSKGKEYTSHNIEFIRKYITLLLVMSIVTIVFWLFFGEHLIRFLFGASYSSGFRVSVVILIAAFFLIIRGCLWDYLVFLGVTDKQLGITILHIIGLILAALLFCHFFHLGLLGVGYSILLASICSSLYSIFIVVNYQVSLISWT